MLNGFSLSFQKAEMSEVLEYVKLHEKMALVEIASETKMLEFEYQNLINKISASMKKVKGPL